MGNIVETLKFLFIGVLVALLIGVVVYFTLPKVENYDAKATPTDETTYSATIYGIPDIDVNHYRLDEDQYFDKLINGVLFVGRFDPANYPVWYKEKLEDNIREELFELIKGLLVYDEDDNLDLEETYLALELELSDLTVEESNTLLFISWYETIYGEFDLESFMTLEEAEKLMIEAKEKLEEEAEVSEGDEESQEEGQEEGQEEDSEVGLDGSGEAESEEGNGTTEEGNDTTDEVNGTDNGDLNNQDNNNNDDIQQANNVNTNEVNNEDQNINSDETNQH